jgi:hypothetical protein
MFPRGLIFRMIIPLNLVKSSSLVACDSVLLSRILVGYVLYVKSGSKRMGLR